MLEFSLPDLSSTEIVLQPETRTVRKGRETATSIAAEHLRARLTLGTPVAVRLTPKTVAGYPPANVPVDAASPDATGNCGAKTSNNPALKSARSCSSSVRYPG
jgi:hypothetical protein